jgi:hypothetical protein
MTVQATSYTTGNYLIALASSQMVGEVTEMCSAILAPYSVPE